MSHYSVLVITDENTTVENLLAPYDENLDVEPYIEKTREEIIEQAKKDDNKYLDEMVSCYKNKVETSVNITGFNWKQRIPTKEEIEKATEIVKNSNDEDIIKRYKRINTFWSDCNFDEEDNELTTYNPDSKWDWYTVGGRWDGEIPTLSGERVNSCLVSEISWKPDADEARHAERFWEINVEGKALQNGEDADDFRCFYNKKYYIDNYGSKAEFVETCCNFGTYAVVTPDGEWHEAGPMGWFGLSCADGDSSCAFRRGYKNLVVEYAKDGYIATMVDCHI